MGYDSRRSTTDAACAATIATAQETREPRGTARTEPHCTCTRRTVADQSYSTAPAASVAARSHLDPQPYEPAGYMRLAATRNG